MRIGVDVRYLSHGLVGGVHTYVRYLVPALIEQSGGHQIFLYADDKLPFEIEPLPAGVTLRRLRYRNGLSSVWQDWWALRACMERDRLDLAHFPANYGFAPAGVKSVITLHDQLNVMPWLPIVKRFAKVPRTAALYTYLHVCSTAAVRRAEAIVTVSEYSRREIARHVAFDPARIFAVHIAPPPQLGGVPEPAALEAVRRRHDLPARFVLADGLKNPAVLVRAWRLLPEAVRTGRQIVFFSRLADPPAVIRKAVAAGQARLLTRPSDEDLKLLFCASEVFVHPSWIEGFGIPILEAMACGTPVIASDRGSIPEVAGEAALLVDAEDEQGLAAHLVRVLAEPQEAERLRALGLARAAHFSWARTARQTLDVFEAAVASRRA